MQDLGHGSTSSFCDQLCLCLASWCCEALSSQKQHAWLRHSVTSHTSVSALYQSNDSLSLTSCQADEQDRPGHRSRTQDDRGGLKLGIQAFFAGASWCIINASNSCSLAAASAGSEGLESRRRIVSMHIRQGLVKLPHFFLCSLC